MDRSLEQTSLQFFMCRKGLATLPRHRRAEDLRRRALGMQSPRLQPSLTPPAPLWSWELAGTCPAGVHGETSALTAWQAHLCPPELPCSAHSQPMRGGPLGLHTPAPLQGADRGLGRWAVCEHVNSELGQHQLPPLSQGTTGALLVSDVQP